MNYDEGFNNLSELERKILDASRIEFEKMGYHKASIDEIAKDLQIGKGTIYRHFGSKLKLFITVVFVILSKMIEEINLILSIEDFDEAFLMFIDKIIEASKNAGRLLSTISLEENSQEFKNELRNDSETKTFFKSLIQKRRSSIQVLKEILEKGKKEARIFPDINAKVQAEIIFITIFDFLRIKLTNWDFDKDMSLQSSYSLEEGITEMKKFICNGIGFKQNKK